MSKTNCVLIFMGEVPEVVLCESVEQAKSKIFEAFESDEEQQKLFNMDFDNDDFWTLDEAGNRFCFSVEMSELDSVTIYMMKQSNASVQVTA